jgi:ankyrin repeat protein
VSGDDSFRAIEAGDADRLKELIEADASLAGARNESGLSAIMWALYRGRIDMVEMLLGGGLELDVFEAASLGRTDRLEAILESDSAKAHAWSPDGFTPLHLAAFFGHVEAVRALLARNAQVDAVSRNPMNVMPLHSAAAGPGNRAPVGRALLDAGAEVDARSHGGFTALQEAAENGDEDLMELLLARGADPTLTNDDGKSAADLAIDRGHEELAESLRGEAT